MELLYRTATNANGAVHVDWYHPSDFGGTFPLMCATSHGLHVAPGVPVEDRHTAHGQRIADALAHNPWTAPVSLLDVHSRRLPVPERLPTDPERDRMPGELTRRGVGV